MVVKKEKIAISINKELLLYVDTLIDRVNIKNRSQAIEVAVKKHMGVKAVKDAVIFLFKHDMIYFQYQHEGTTFLQNMIDFLYEGGIKRVFILSQHAHIEPYIKNADFKGMEVKIEYFTKDSWNLLMLYKVLDELDDNFLVTNGDTLQKFKLSKMVDFFLTSKILASILLIASPLATRYTSIELEGNYVVGFVEQKMPKTSIIFGGTAIFNKSAFNILDKAKDKRMENDLFGKLIPGRQINGFFNYGEYIHMPEIYDKDYKERLKKLDKEQEVNQKKR